VLEGQQWAAHLRCEGYGGIKEMMALVGLERGRSSRQTTTLVTYLDLPFIAAAFWRARVAIPPGFGTIAVSTGLEND
jgi:hypothetical protein